MHGIDSETLLTLLHIYTVQVEQLVVTSLSCCGLLPYSDLLTDVTISLQVLLAFLYVIMHDQYHGA